MKYYAVIDTNVLVSAMLKWESVPGAVLLEALTGKITPLLNGEIVQEYRDVLSRPKFHFPSEAVEVFMEGLTRRGLLKKSCLTPKTSFFMRLSWKRAGLRKRIW